MDLATTLRLTLAATATKTGDLTGGPQSTPQITLSDTLADGIAVDQANIVYFDTGALIADASVGIDLNGTLTDVFGDQIDAARVKAFCVKNTSSTASVLKVGGGSDKEGTNAFDTWIASSTATTSNLGSEAVYVRPGGVFLLWAPDATAYAVTAGTVDILGIHEMSTLAATYEVLIIMTTT